MQWLANLRGVLAVLRTAQAGKALVLVAALALAGLAVLEPAAVNRLCASF